jgi:hypothetical protein
MLRDAALVKFTHHHQKQVLQSLFFGSLSSRRPIQRSARPGGGMQRKRASHLHPRVIKSFSLSRRRHTFSIQLKQLTRGNISRVCSWKMHSTLVGSKTWSIKRLLHQRKGTLEYEKYAEILNLETI